MLAHSAPNREAIARGRRVSETWRRRHRGGRRHEKSDHRRARGFYQSPYAWIADRNPQVSNGSEPVRGSATDSAARGSAGSARMGMASF